MTFSSSMQSLAQTPGTIGQVGGRIKVKNDNIRPTIYIYLFIQLNLTYIEPIMLAYLAIPLLIPLKRTIEVLLIPLLVTLRQSLKLLPRLLRCKPNNTISTYDQKSTLFRRDIVDLLKETAIILTVTLQHLTYSLCLYTSVVHQQYYVLSHDSVKLSVCYI